jgi:diguanylate cyclase (GGDEF)-like protein
MSFVPSRSAFEAQLSGTPAPPAVIASQTSAARAFMTVGAAVFLASIIGLASRHAFSVSFWPANAVLVGLMVRHRPLIQTQGWIGSALGFIAADLLFGQTVLSAGLFAATNIIGSATAVAFLCTLDLRDLRLRSAHSVLRILACLLPACFAAALCGAILVRIAFDGSATQALMTWPASELVNYLITLPAMLTVSFGRLGNVRRRWTSASVRWRPGPVLGLILSCAAAAYFDGPGSIMFPMPALLLCAMTYSLPSTTLLTMALGAGCLTAIGMGAVDIGQDMSIPAMVVSIRIAVAFLVLVPLSVSSAMAVRDDLLRQLRATADHDGLTGLLNRCAFEQRMLQRLSIAPAAGFGFVVLWLDIDHFKAINDRHGHMAGDLVLKGFARIARTCCREEDLVGRMGGEEFALVARASGTDAAVGIAERLGAAFAAETTFWNGMPVQATVSIGACYLDRAVHSVPDLQRHLDEALYRAKHKGRDRIEWFRL